MKHSEPMPALIEAVTKTIRQSMETLCQKETVCNADVLSAEVVATVSQLLHQSLFDGARAGLAQFIESYDAQEQSVVRDNKTYRFKEVSSKSFLTIFGPVTVNRRRYCHWSGGRRWFHWMNIGPWTVATRPPRSPDICCWRPPC